MSATSEQDEKAGKAKGRKPRSVVFGPCGDCAFYMDEETPEQHTTGVCHGAPPQRGLGWPVVAATASGCATFRPR